VGHIFLLYTIQRKKEQEIEQLKIENLQSRCDALANQINPHFFFNSLNGLSSLIRKKNNFNTLAYVNKLSDVFRYILHSDKKRLVTLEEEFDFLQSFRYMMEVRFANKLEFDVEVQPEMMNCRLPVLSILPLIDNVVVHNMIDSDHKMTVAIRVNEQKELVVSNPVYPKLTPPDTNGTGLKNLKNRFQLLMNRKIRIEDSGDMFRVYLPLNEYSDEGIDC
jgi:LytS/YehU family sensor histidine kinase